MSKNKTRNGGVMKRLNAKAFTLIELVMVIVILGILAATAIPKFSDLNKQAHLAAINGVVGGVRSGIAIFHASYLINTSLTGANPTSGYPLDLDGKSGGPATSLNPLFGNVLSQGGIMEKWTKASGALTGDGSVDYSYTALDSTANTYTYTNYDAGATVFAGTFVVKQ